MAPSPMHYIDSSPHFQSSCSKNKKFTRQRKKQTQISTRYSEFRIQILSILLLLLSFSFSLLFPSFKHHLLLLLGLICDTLLDSDPKSRFLFSFPLWGFEPTVKVIASYMHYFNYYVMRLRGVASCLSLLLLLLFLFLLKTSPTSSDGSAKFQSFKSGPIPFQAKPGFANQKTHKGDDEDHGSEVAPPFGDEKRKIYTGPNPLHNR